MWVILNNFKVTWAKLKFTWANLKSHELWEQSLTYMRINQKLPKIFVWCICHIFHTWMQLQNIWIPTVDSNNACAMTLYFGLHFKEKIAPMKEMYYDGSYASELLFKARSLSLEVNSRTYRFPLTKNKECLGRLSGIDETVEHMVCECQAYGGERKILIKNIVESAGASTLE